MKNLLSGTAAVSILALAVPALAQDAQTESKGQAEVLEMRTVALADWNYDELYQPGSWTAERLLDAEVIGPGGDEIGSVENIVIGADGKAAAVIAEVGGFWDIGDTHVRIPWSEVDTTSEDGEMRVQVPVTEESVENYDLFGDIEVVEDDDPATPRGWRATELMHDYVTLEGGERYGWMRDLVFDEQGQLQAVVVDALYGTAPGLYAYPYYGYEHGFRPGSPYYRMPYGAGDMSEIEAFDYERLAELAEQQ
jgi:sporulation protein YlmC with PRC-barrel domain